MTRELPVEPRSSRQAGNGIPAACPGAQCTFMSTPAPRWPGFWCKATFPNRLVSFFNTGRFTGSLAEGPIPIENTTLKMTSTRIEWSFNKIARMADLSDLAEMLFPGNRNQQHAILVVWVSLKWADHHMVPNLAKVAADHGISRRTLERVRAKMRRIGLIDHVSRFSGAHGYREAWTLSTRFERSLGQIAEKTASFRDPDHGSKDKDEMLLQLAEVRSEAAAAVPDHDQPEEESSIT